MTVFPDHAAVDYDERIENLVPGYALALALFGCTLAGRINPQGTILVPGCGTGSEILALASTLAAPVATSLGARGVVPTRHPLAIGVAGNYAAPPAP